MDWKRKTLTITAYAKTKSQGRLIDDYIEASGAKFKRLVQDKRVSKRWTAGEPKIFRFNYVSKAQNQVLYGMVCNISTHV